MADFIYVLRDPRTNAVRYVGKTKNPSSRKKAHSSPSQIRGQGIRKIEWTTELRSLGLRPVFEIIEECEAGKWKEREEFWIAHYGLENLVNVRPDATPGNFNACGEGTREKLRRAVLKQFADATRRQNHKEAMRRWSANLTDKERMVLSAGGKVASSSPAFVAARKIFWESMDLEQRQRFIKERSEKQKATPKKLSNEEVFEILSKAQKLVWKDERKRKNRIEGIKAGWADPIKRALRIEKNRLTRSSSG